MGGMQERGHVMSRSVGLGDDRPTRLKGHFLCESVELTERKLVETVISEKSCAFCCRPVIAKQWLGRLIADKVKVEYHRENVYSCYDAGI